MRKKIICRSKLIRIAEEKGESYSDVVSRYMRENPDYEIYDDLGKSII